VEFEDFFRQEYGVVYRACVAFLGTRELAQEATQEAFARAFARWSRLRGKPWRTGWVMTTALNVARKTNRTEARHASLPLPSSHLMTVKGPDPDRITILMALRRLSSRQATVALLHYFCDLSVHEIADLLGIGDGAVKSHLFRARRHLEASLRTRGSPAGDTGEEGKR